MAKCTHERYKQGHHLVASEALKAMTANKICWRGTVITECEDCGADLSKYNVVPVRTADDYLSGLNIDADSKGRKRGKRK